jgi:hypothetical protein
VVRGSNNPVVAIRTAADDGLLTYVGFSNAGFQVVVAGQEMTLPEAQAPETVRRLRLIRTAADDGLLTYVGFSNAGFQVMVAGREVVLPEAAARETVRRLRLIDEVQRRIPVGLVELGDDGTFVLSAGGFRRSVAGADLRDWLRGYEAAFDAVGQKHDGVDQLGEIEQVLRNPGRDDQCRMVLLGLMAVNGVSADTLRARLGGPDPDDPSKSIKPPTKKTVVDALGFGNPLSSVLADRMIAALGYRWAVSSSGAVRAGSGEPVEQPEMPGVTRLRMLLGAYTAGWLRYVGTPSVNWARRSRTYDVMVGRQEHTVSRASLPAWLAGVAAFHGVAEVPLA